MARIPSSNPLTQALDKRIRVVVEETLDDAVRVAIRNIVREELSQALGGTVAPPPAIGARRVGRPPGRRIAAGRKGRAAAAPEEGTRKCEVVGCKRPYRSQGYCAAHYQAARKYEWPMPAPENFTPPARPSRGRPPKEASAKAD